MNNSLDDLRDGCGQFSAMALRAMDGDASCMLDEREKSLLVRGIFLDIDRLIDASPASTLRGLIFMANHRALYCTKPSIGALERMLVRSSVSVVRGGACDTLIACPDAMTSTAAISIVEALLGRTIAEYLRDRREFAKGFLEEAGAFRDELRSTDGLLLGEARDLAGDLVDEMLQDKRLTESLLSSGSSNAKQAAEIIIEHHWNNIDCSMS